MAQTCAKAFRSTFGEINKELLQWFPGHMGKGLKQMQQKLKTVDCIIEVHDARIPLTGRNSEFKYTIRGIKPHILVMNKIDLIDRKLFPKIRECLKEEYEHVLFTNCKDHQDKGVKSLFPLAQKLISSSDRYNRTNRNDYNMMIIGVPNVGKSSLINSLRNRFLGKSNASPVGAVPGITKSVLNKIKMCDDPLFYLLDTPGILVPRVESTEAGLKLALCAIIQDHLVGENIIADYLLYWLNKHKHFDYVSVFGLGEATDNILDVLLQIAKVQNKFLKIKDVNNQYVLKPDLNFAAKHMITCFRKQQLGKIMLDEDML